MLVKSWAIFFAATVAGLLAAHIPTSQNYWTVSDADHVHHAAGHQFLTTGIIKPCIKFMFQASLFSNSCNDGFVGQVTGSNGANCVRSISGTKGIALNDQSGGCTVTVYTDENCWNGATLHVPE